MDIALFLIKSREGEENFIIARSMEDVLKTSSMENIHSIEKMEVTITPKAIGNIYESCQKEER